MTITLTYEISLKVDRKFNQLFNPCPVARKTISGTLERETAARTLREAFEGMIQELAAEQWGKRRAVGKARISAS